MGRAILEMQDLYIAVELPDDVVREFILEALNGKLGELPGKPDRAQEEPPPSDNDSQPAAQEVPVFLKLSREEKEQQILEVIESSSEKITTSMIAKQLGVKSNHINKILSDLYKEGLVSRERVQVVGKAYPEFAYTIKKEAPIKAKKWNRLKKVNAILSVFENGEELTAEEIFERLREKGIRFKQKNARSFAIWLGKNMKGSLDCRKVNKVFLWRLPGTQPGAMFKRMLNKDVEREIYRLYYREGLRIHEIALRFKALPEDIKELVHSERGKLYAKVNTDPDTEKLQETLKKEVELMKDLTRDAAVEGET